MKEITKTVTLYRCETCGQCYRNKDQAETCEKLHENADKALKDLSTMLFAIKQMCKNREQCRGCVLYDNENGECLFATDAQYWDDVMIARITEGKENGSEVRM